MEISQIECWGNDGRLIFLKILSCGRSSQFGRKRSIRAALSSLFISIIHLPPYYLTFSIDKSTAFLSSDLWIIPTPHQLIDQLSPLCITQSEYIEPCLVVNLWQIGKLVMFGIKICCSLQFMNLDMLPTLVNVKDRNIVGSPLFKTTVNLSTSAHHQLLSVAESSVAVSCLFLVAPYFAPPSPPPRFYRISAAPPLSSVTNFLITIADH